MIPSLARLAHTVYYRATGSTVAAHLRRLERSQWDPPERIRERQLGRLNGVLIHAGATVPFYRERFRSAGFDPRGFMDPAELARLPLLTKSDIRAAGDRLLSDVHRAGDLSPFASGGPRASR